MLILARDQEPLIERQRLLLENGFEVILVSEFSAVFSLVRTRAADFDFLVTGYTVPEKERLDLARMFRLVNPAGRVIFLYKSVIRNRDSAAVLLSINGPADNLLSAMQGP